MSVLTPNEIFKQLSGRFERAREGGDLLFFDSTVVTHDEGGVEVRFLKSFLVLSEADCGILFIPLVGLPHNPIHIVVRFMFTQLEPFFLFG